MLSKKTQYALQALAYMVENQKATPILIAEIADKKNIYWCEASNKVKGCIVYKLYWRTYEKISFSSATELPFIWSG